MKKIISIAAAALMLLAGTEAYAQIYVGGSAGFANTTVKVGENSASGTTFKILPEIGFQLNDKMAIGAQIGYMNGPGALGSFDPNDIKGLISGIGDAVCGAASSKDVLGYQFGAFRIAPYFRYTFYSNNLIELFADATIAYTNALAKSYDEDDQVWQDRGACGIFEAGIKPGFKVKVSDNFQLVGRLGSLGYQNLKVKDQEMSASRFGLDVDGSNILFGFIYTL